MARENSCVQLIIEPYVESFQWKVKKESIRKANSLKGFPKLSWEVGAQWSAAEDRNDQKVDLQRRAPCARRPRGENFVAHVSQNPETSLQVRCQHKKSTRPPTSDFVCENDFQQGKRHATNLDAAEISPEKTKLVCNEVLKDRKCSLWKLKTLLLKFRMVIADNKFNILHYYYERHKLRWDSRFNAAH